MNIRPIRDGIIFQFEDEIDRTAKSGFKNKTESGIVLGVNMDDSTKTPRWGKVVFVGNDVVDKDIVPGSRICIEPMMWTNEVVIEGVSYWKTDESKVLLAAWPLNTPNEELGYVRTKAKD